MLSSSPGDAVGDNDDDAVATSTQGGHGRRHGVGLDLKPKHIHQSAVNRSEAAQQVVRRFTAAPGISGVD